MNHGRQIDVQKICHLLRTTDMVMPDIAIRFHISISVVKVINDKFKIRKYTKGRAWVLATS